MSALQTGMPVFRSTPSTKVVRSTARHTAAPGRGPLLVSKSLRCCAADITAFKATRVPVGADQAPLIEQTNEIVRRINAATDAALLPEAEAIIPTSGRLPGIDGNAKMSKSGVNAITLSAFPDAITAAVRAMFRGANWTRGSSCSA